MRELRLAGGCSIVAAAGLMLMGPAEPAPEAVSKDYTVIVENMRFDPQVLTVKSGDRITWVNKDLFPHTATSAGKTFDSRGIAPNASWTWTSGRPGRYAYTCAFHPTMQGTVTVR